MVIDNIKNKLHLFIPGPKQEADEWVGVENMQKLQKSSRMYSLELGAIMVHFYCR